MAMTVGGWDRKVPIQGLTRQFRVAAPSPVQRFPSHPAIPSKRQSVPAGDVPMKMVFRRYNRLHNVGSRRARARD